MSNKLIDKNRTINEFTNSERKFSEIFLNSPFGIVCFSKLGKIVDVNPAFCKIADIPREEFVGKLAISVIRKKLSAKHIPIMLKRIKNLLLGKLIEPYELEFNGKMVEFHPPAKSYKNVFMTFVRDVSELRKNEQERENYITELKEAEERYHSIFENVGVAIWEEDFTELKAAIDTKKAKGIKDFRAYLNKHPEFVEQAVGMIKILDVNNESLKMYKAQNKKDLLDSLHKTFVTESLFSFKEELIAIFDGKREFITEEITRDLHGERIYILLKIAFPEYNKPFDRVLVSMMDITDRKKTEDALNESEEKYRGLFESSADFVYTVDLKGKFTEVNTAATKMTGYSKSELIGKSFAEYTDKKEQIKLLRAYTKVKKTGIPLQDFPFHVIINSGESRDMEGSVILLKKEGKIIGFQGSARDITERKIANENVKAQKEHIELINSILRHDISNDLSVITSALRLYERSPKKELFDEVSNRITHSLSLISRMKNLEMFLSKRSNLLPVSIKKIVNEIKDSFPSMPIDLVGNARVMADSKLFSVFKNIVQNAIRHGKCTSIKIEVIKDSNFCMIKIADNGHGIPTEAKENLFEKGYKFGKTGHTGLGLYIVKRSVEEFGGMVYTEDNNPHGTIVIIRLKLVS